MRIVHFVVPRTHFVILANAGISGCHIGGEIPGRGPGRRAGEILMRARKESQSKRVSPPANDDRLSKACSSESLVPAWSLVLIHIPGWNHLSDSIIADPDGPLQIRRLSSIGFEKVVVVFAQ